MTSSTPKLKKILVKKLPKFTLDVYAPIAINDLVVFAVSFLEERGVTASTEEVISICFRLFPKSFGIKNYSHWPDSALVMRRLTDAREKKNIKGSANDGFAITFKGKQIANRVAKALGVFKPVIKKAPAKNPIKKKTVVAKTSIINKQVKEKPIAKKIVVKKPIEKKTVATKQPIQKPAVIKKTVTKKPIEKETVVTKQPISKPVLKKKVVAKKPVEQKQIVAKQSIQKSIVTKKVITKKPIEKKAVVTKQLLSKPVVTKKVVTKKPIKKKPVVTKQPIQKPVVAKKVATKKPAEQKQVAIKQSIQKPVEEKKEAIVSQPKQLTLSMPVVEAKPKVEAQKQVAVKKEAAKPVKINPVVVQVSKEEKVKAGKVMMMVERSDAYRIYQKDGKKSKISEFDFRNMLFATMESSSDTLARNIELFKKYANIHNRNNVILFLSFCEEKFSVLLKKKR